MLEQWMLLNKKINIEQDAYRNDEESGKKDETTPKSDETTPKGVETTPKSDETTPKSDETTQWVYICTTMYREVIFVYSMLDRKVNYLIEILCRVLSSMPFKYVLNLFVLKCR